MSGRPLAIVTSTVPLTLRSFHQELLRQLAQRGYEVLVVSSPSPDLEVLGKTYRTAQIEMQRDIALSADARAFWAWLRLMCRERPALLVTATPKASLLGQLTGALTGVRRRAYYLGGLRLEAERGPKRWLLRWMERLTSGCAHVVIANSPSLAQAALRTRAVRPSSLKVTEPGSSHGVDAEYFSPRPPDRELADRLGVDPSMPTIGFVGRLTADKGIDTLIEALGHLKRTGPCVQLLVVANLIEGDSAAHAETLRSSGMKVTLSNAVDDIRPLVSLMDVHALPTRREGFPNVVLETAAMGVPTVTTTATGAIDSVQHGVTGFTVPVDDAGALAEALGTLLSDPHTARAFGEEARLWVRKEFVPTAVVSSLVQHILGSE